MNGLLLSNGVRVTGHLDGIALYVGDELQAVYPSTLQAMTALNALRQAERALADITNTKREA